MPLKMLRWMGGRRRVRWREERLWRALLLFPWSRSSKKSGCFMASSNCIEVDPGFTWNSQSRNVEMIPFEVVVFHIDFVLNLPVASLVACVLASKTESDNSCTVASWNFGKMESMGLAVFHRLYLKWFEVLILKQQVSLRGGSHQTANEGVRDVLNVREVGLHRFSH